MSDDEIREGFVRQRRSLIAVSLALLFYQTTGVVVERLSLFGNEVVLRDPSAASIVLWVAWVYFLVRYYQHFHDTPSKGLWAAHHDRLQMHVKRLASAQFEKECRAEQARGELSGQIDFTRIDPSVMGRKGGAWEIRVRAPKLKPGANPSHPNPQHEVLIRVGGSPLRLAQIRASLHAAFHTRFLTEYYLPFVVAAVPPAFMLWRFVME